MDGFREAIYIKGGGRATGAASFGNTTKPLLT